MVCGTQAWGEPAPAVSGTTGELPRRVLGKTKQSVTAITLGTAPCGHSREIGARQVADVVNTGLDAGINFVDTAPIYGNAEEGVGLALGSRRKDVFLATKVWADTVPAAEKSLARSLQLLKTDYLDLLYFHNLASRDVEKAWDDDGVFTWLLKQKEKGTIRFVGASGHALVDRFGPFIESDKLDVVLIVLNFADRYTYGVEERVLPLARKHNVGVVAMKVYGGIQGGFPNYNGPPRRSQLDDEYRELSVRYTMGLPGVTSLNIGAHDGEQVLRNVAMAKNYRPLSPEEQERLSVAGRRLATEWGPRLGPVA